MSNPSKDWLIGNDPVVEEIRNADWTNTPLGPLKDWQPELKSVANLILQAQFPMALGWGAERSLIYNHAFKREIIRHPASHIIGKSLDELWAPIWPQYHDAMDRVFNRAESLSFRNQPFTISEPAGQSKIAWISSSLSPVFDNKSQVVGCLFVGIDISQQKELENHLRRKDFRLSFSLEASQAGIWDYELANSTFTFSKEMQKLFGLPTDQFSFSTEDWKSFVHPDDLTQTLQDATQAVQEGRSYHGEYRIVRPDGKLKWICSRGDIEYEGELPARIVGIAFDITDRKGLESELLEAIAVRDEFISVATHELKTPLTALQMQLQLLNRLITKSLQPTDLRINQLTSGILGSAQDLNTLLNDLLDVTRIRVGKMRLNCKEVNLNSAIQKNIELMSESIAISGSRIDFFTNDTIVGFWDPCRINQVLNNLLSNAIKYGNANPIEISLSANESRTEAIIRVKDHGIGIPKEMQDRIFERFQRGVNSKTFTGLGLGLYITRQIVDAHGGVIWVESEPENGTLFTVQLPITLPAESS